MEAHFSFNSSEEEVKETLKQRGEWIRYELRKPTEKGEYLIKVLKVSCTFDCWDYHEEIKLANIYVDNTQLRDPYGIEITDNILSWFKIPKDENYYSY